VVVTVLLPIFIVARGGRGLVRGVSGDELRAKHTMIRLCGCTVPPLRMALKQFSAPGQRDAF
jgi:hypothetical protein